MSRDVQMIVTPRVVDEVRRYFNCPILEGAELEDQGEEGTALTHWEKRVFEVSLAQAVLPDRRNYPLRFFSQKGFGPTVGAN